MAEPLKDRVALITGASQGIGLAIARVLVDQGVHVVCTARNVTRLQESISGFGELATAFRFDVNDPEQCETLVTRLPDTHQPVTILINNAGHDVGGLRPFQDGDSRDWDDVIETNIKGMMRTTHALLPTMVARDMGDIINIGSVAGVYTARNQTAYYASKHAVHGFSEALRRDLDQTGLKVTEILPGTVRTHFAENRLRGDTAKAEAFYDSFALCLQPEDIADAVLFALKQPARAMISQIMIEPARKSAG